jgi:hypothetical protein
MMFLSKTGLLFIGDTLFPDYSINADATNTEKYTLQWQILFW